LSSDSETIQKRFRNISGDADMYSTADIAKRLGCTVQAVNSYRRKVEKRIQKSLGQPDPADARRTLYTEDEVAMIGELAPKIPVTPPSDDQVVEAELVDGEDTTEAIALEHTSLALRHSTLPAVQQQAFDLNAVREDIAAIDAHSLQTVSRADNLLSQFAQNQLLAAAADIQQTIATMKANALGDAAAHLGKPVEAPVDDGRSA
jgi:hypothetical protein